MYNVWLFTKWYPNREDPQLGVFIQKHARAIALRHRVNVLYLHSVSGLQSNFETVISQSEKLTETIIYYKKDHGIFRLFVNGFRYLTALRNGLIYLKTNAPDPDIFHAYILLRPALIAWYLSVKKKKPFVISEQWSGYVTGKYEKKSFLRKLITRQIVKKASAVSVVSRFLSGGIKRNGLQNRNTFITPNCIEINPVQSVTTTNQSVYILIVADLVDEIKNISGVLRMISKLGETKPFELHIVGHGKDEKMLKKLSAELKLEDRVFFEGLKTNSEVYQYLHRCDFLVMNSMFETFSLICAEAMSCGKPVIATRCGGPDEFVTGETGLLIKPGDETDLQKAFIKMLAEFSTYDGGKITAYATKLFSPQMASEEFDRLYKTATEGSK